MIPGPAGAAPRVSEFYERKRRLAYHFAWISMALLLVQLSVGSILEFFSLPRPTVAPDGVCLLHRCLSQDEADGSRLLQLDAAMKLKTEPLRLLDSASAALSESTGLTVFYGSRAAVLTDGRNSRPVDLGQKWDVLAAVRDPDRAAAWIAGWSDGKIVVRRRDEKGAWGTETAVAPSGLLDRLTLAMDGAAGPLVAWREHDAPRVRTALFDGRAFVPGAELDLGLAQHWDAALSQGRTLLTLYNRDDRTYDSITLRLSCCPGCPAPVSPRKITFGDPVLLIGRKITGLSTIVIGDRLRLFLTRPSRILTAALPLATLQPDPASSRFHVIPVDPLWRTIVGSITPTLLIFCSASLVCLGFTLLRERARSAGAAGSGEAAAGMMPRLMAYALDFCLLGPSCYALMNILDLPIEGLDDPRAFWLLALWVALEFLYHLAMEWGLGWTVGKKIVGLRVTGLDGRKLTLREALVRNATRIVDGTIPFSGIIGLALILRTPQRQRLGDLVAGTRVAEDIGSNP